MTLFRPIERARLHLENIKFSHSVFALPFALAGACLAARDREAGRIVPPPETLILIIGAVVAARTCAMAANRVADARLDAKNPRTAARPIPAGRLSAREVAAAGAGAGLAFIVLSYLLSPLCGALAPAVLFILVGYSYSKRFTSLAHGALGLSLGLAPAGAWLAVQGDFGGNIKIPILLTFAVTAWVAGFDLIYACQDEEHDRGAGLYSIPSRFGAARALHVSSALHAAAAVLFIYIGRAAGLGLVYYVCSGVICALLAAEHALVRPGDLGRVNAAFFTLNGWIGVLYAAGVAADLAAPY